MAIQLYDTHTLMGVVRTLHDPVTFWLDLCFPTVQTFDTEYIDFDVIDRQRRMAPFVVPTAQGVPMYQQGYTTRQFKPAYSKMKDVVDPRRVIKRQAGEMIGGSLSNEQRRMAIITDILQHHRNYLVRRMEWMAANAVIGGQVTIAGENYPSSVVQFGRDAGQTVVLGSGSRWGDAGVNILSLIDDWGTQTQQLSSYAPTLLIMGTNAWKVFISDTNVQRVLDTRRGSQSRLETGPGSFLPAQYKGTLGASLEAWTYNDIYTDNSGANQPIMDPSSIVLLNPAGVEGVRTYGAILDANAGYIPTEIYARNWIDDDPAVEMVMTQSSPLPIVTRPNAVFTAKVVA